MNCNIIQRELMKWVMSAPSDIVVPNYYLGPYECDVMKVSKAGQIYEYEIKTSKADFKKDFEKARSGAFIGKGETVQLKHGLYTPNIYERITKHDDIQAGKRCSRFYFVVPDGLIKKEDVPDGLGLIYAIQRHSEIHPLTFDIVKMSKNFGRLPVDINFYRHIAQNLTLKLIAAKNKVMYLRK